MPDTSHAPGWIALALAGITGVTQVLTTLVQRPRAEKKAKTAAEDAAAVRHQALVQHVNNELSAAMAQFAQVKRLARETAAVSSSSLPNFDQIEQTLKRLEASIASLEGHVRNADLRLTTIEREREHEQRQHEVDTKTNVDIQLVLRELLTEVRVMKERHRS